MHQFSLRLKKWLGEQGVTYGVVQRSHSIVMLADLCCYREQYTADWYGMLHSQFNPLASDFDIRVGVV
jgi:hypothetical protein